MKKGIVLFDIKDFLYQGLIDQDPTVEVINERQSQVLGVLHAKMATERARRLSSNTPIPKVDIFLPTGDGYYLLCSPGILDTLDIAHCIMALLDANDIKAYAVAHVGEINVFTDMTGRENATGFDLGLANRLMSASRVTGSLTCSESIVDLWQENQYFELEGRWNGAIGKDNQEYRWRLAAPSDFHAARARFSP